MAQAPPGDAELEKLAHAKFKQLQIQFLANIMEVPEQTVLSQLQEVEDLVRKGVFNVNRPIKPATDSRFLHTAVWHQRVELVRWLLQYGADPNAGNKKGNTPVHFACERINDIPSVGPEILRLLVNAGGDVFAKDEKGETPADRARAAKFDIDAFLQRLKAQQQQAAAARQANVAVKLEEQKKAKRAFLAQQKLRKAIELGDIAMVAKMVNAGADMIQDGVYSLDDVKGKGDGRTALHAAAIAQRPDLVLQILHLKASPNVQDAAGETPLHHAARFTASPVGKQVILALLAAGANKTGIKSYVENRSAIQCAPTKEERAWILTQQPPPLKFDALGAAAPSAVSSSPAAAAPAASVPVPASAASSMVPAAQAAAAAGAGAASSAQQRHADVSGKAEDSSSGGGVGGGMGYHRWARAGTIASQSRRKVLLSQARSTVKSDTVYNLLMNRAYGGVLSDDLILEAHHVLHGCTASEELVRDCVRACGAKCTKANFADFMQSMIALCDGQEALNWDVECLDPAGKGYLPAAQAKLLWGAAAFPAAAFPATASRNAKNAPTAGNVDYQALLAGLVASI